MKTQYDWDFVYEKTVAISAWAFIGIQVLFLLLMAIQLLLELNPFCL